VKPVGIAMPRPKFAVDRCDVNAPAVTAIIILQCGELDEFAASA
jgi:hypothetical protein